MTMINRTDVDEVINELSSRQTGRRVLSKSQSQEDDAIAGGKAACLITAQHFHSYYWFKDDLLDGNRISWIYENIHNHNENGDSKRKVDTPHVEIKHIRTLKGRHFVLGLRRMKSERKPHHTTPFMCPLRRRWASSIQRDLPPVIHPKHILIFSNQKKQRDCRPRGPVSPSFLVIYILHGHAWDFPSTET